MRLSFACGTSGSELASPSPCTSSIELTELTEALREARRSNESERRLRSMGGAPAGAAAAADGAPPPADMRASRSRSMAWPCICCTFQRMPASRSCTPSWRSVGTVSIASTIAACAVVDSGPRWCATLISCIALCSRSAAAICSTPPSLRLLPSAAKHCTTWRVSRALNSLAIDGAAELSRLRLLSLIVCRPEPKRMISIARAFCGAVRPTNWAWPERSMTPSGGSLTATRASRYWSDALLAYSCPGAAFELGVTVACDMRRAAGVSAAAVASRAALSSF